MDNIQYNRLLELKKVIESNQANQDQKLEYMKILYENGQITKQHYQQYLNSRNSDEIIKTALVIGGVMLATWLLGKLLE